MMLNVFFVKKRFETPIWTILVAISWTPALKFIPLIHWIMPYPLCGNIFGFVLLTAFDKFSPLEQ